MADNIQLLGPPSVIGVDPESREPVYFVIHFTIDGVDWESGLMCGTIALSAADGSLSESIIKWGGLQIGEEGDCEEHGIWFIQKEDKSGDILFNEGDAVPFSSNPLLHQEIVRYIEFEIHDLECICHGIYSMN